MLMDRVLISRNDKKRQVNQIRNEVKNEESVVREFEETQHHDFPAAVAATLPGFAKCSLTTAATSSTLAEPGWRSTMLPNRSNAESSEPQRSSSDRNACKAKLSCVATTFSR